MASQSPAQKKTVERVMHEFKHGELRIRGSGPKVKNPKQAIAIALHEAGASKYESPKENRENLRKTKAKGAPGRHRQGPRRGPRPQVLGGQEPGARRPSKTRRQLYEQAKRRDIPGRSKMSKADLERALQR